MPSSTGMPQARSVATAITIAMAMAMAMVNIAFAANDRGLTQLHRVVDAACGCADAQRNGMAAALACTKGPREFGRLKVMHRDAWDAAARARADDLEKVIQLCLSNALSARAARARLGQPPIRADGSVAVVYWQDIEVRALRADTSQLVRVRQRTSQNRSDQNRGQSTHNSSGAITTGMVLALDAEQLQLRRARRDGGGRKSIALRDIEQVWIMVVND